MRGPVSETEGGYQLGRASDMYIYTCGHTHTSNEGFKIKLKVNTSFIVLMSL